MSMAEYQFTGATPLIFYGLTSGVVPVVRANPDDNQPDGATLILHTGDVVTLPAGFVHANLTEIATEQTETVEVPVKGKK